MNRHELIARRNEIGRCPCCNGNIKDRKLTLYKGIVEALYKVYKLLAEKGVHEFQMSDINHMLSKSDYNRFGDLVRFGGILYRPEDKNGKTRKALYGMNMDRAKEFFTGKCTIPLQIVINQITNEVVSKTEYYFHEFPDLVQFLKENGLYDHEKNILVQAQLPKRKVLVVDRINNIARYEWQ